MKLGFLMSILVVLVLLSPVAQASSTAYARTTALFNVGDIMNFTYFEYSPTPPNEDQDVELNVTFLTPPTTVILELYGTTNYTVTEYYGLEYAIDVGSGNYTAHDSVTWKFYAINMYGTAFTSDEQSFIVANRLPSVTAPLIDNENPTNFETIICGSGIFSDPDDEDTEDLREYMWYIDDVLISGENSATLDISTISHSGEEEVTCKVRVSDGYGYSTWVESSNFATLFFTAGNYEQHQASYVSGDLDNIAVDFFATAGASTIPYVPIIVIILLFVGGLGYLGLRKPKA